MAELNGRQGPPPEAFPEPTPEIPEDLRLYELDDWGVGLRDLTADEARQYGVAGGAYVAYVRQGGAASADGLPTGAVVVAVEGEVVENAAEASAALDRVAQEGETALLRVRRPDGVTAYYDLESLTYAE